MTRKKGAINGRTGLETSKANLDNPYAAYPYTCLAERIKNHLDEAQIIREGLACQGPKLIRKLQDLPEWGEISLRQLACDSDYSVSMLSRIIHGKEIMSKRLYLVLHKILQNRTASHLVNRRKTVNTKKKVSK